MWTRRIPALGTNDVHTANEACVFFSFIFPPLFLHCAFFTPGTKTGTTSLPPEAVRSIHIICPFAAARAANERRAAEGRRLQLFVAP